MIAARTRIGLYEPTSPLGPPSWLAARLTRRQCEIAILVADGYSYKEVGARLGLATVSVSTTVRRIGKKLGLDPHRDYRIQLTRTVALAYAEDDLRASTSVA